MLEFRTSLLAIFCKDSSCEVDIEFFLMNIYDTSERILSGKKLIS